MIDWLVVKFGVPKRSVIRNTIYFNGVIVEVEALLHDRRELADAAALLAEHLLGLGGQDDDLGTCWCHSDLHAAVAILSQLFGEEVVELGLKNTATNKLLETQQRTKAREQANKQHREATTKKVQIRISTLEYKHYGQTKWAFRTRNCMNYFALLGYNDCTRHLGLVYKVKPANGSK